MSAPGKTPRPQFLKPQEVAAALRVSKMTVYREIHLGRLRAVQVGRSFRVFQTALDEYVRDHEVGFDWAIGDEA